MKLVGNSLIYTAVSLLQKALGFFLLPLYTSYLSASDYGVANVVLSIVGFLAIFYQLSLQGAGTRFEYSRGDAGGAREIWGTLFIFTTINASALTLLLILLRRPLLEPFLGGIPFWPCMALGLAAAALSPTYALFQANLQAKQLGKRFGGNNLAYFLVNMSLTVIFITIFSMRAEGILLALAITNLVFFLYTLIDFPHRIDLRFRPLALKESFAYSLPLLPHSMAGWAMGLVDRLILNHYRAAADVGIYSIGTQFGNLINIVTMSVNQAYVPWFFEQFEKGSEGKARIARVGEALVLGYSVCALTVSLFAQEVLTLMVTAEFQQAWIVIPPLAFSFVFSGAYYVFVNPLFVRRTTYVPLVTLASATLGVGLNLWLIPRYGMQGAAFSSLIAMAASALLAHIISSRLEPIGFRLGRIFAYILIPFGLSLVAFLEGYMHLVLFLSVKAIILLGAAATGLLLYREEAGKVWDAFRIKRARTAGS